MSQLFSSGGQSIGASASVSVLPMNIQGWFPLGWTGWISLQSKGLSRVFSSITVRKHLSVLQCSAFFMIQLSHLNLTTHLQPLKLYSVIVFLYFQVLNHFSWHPLEFYFYSFFISLPSFFLSFLFRYLLIIYCVLDKHWPIDFSMMMEMFSVPAFQYGSH